MCFHVNVNNFILKLKKATLITANKSETLHINKVEINIIPLWRWL